MHVSLRRYGLCLSICVWKVLPGKVGKRASVLCRFLSLREYGTRNRGVEGHGEIRKEKEGEKNIKRKGKRRSMVYYH